MSQTPLFDKGDVQFYIRWRGRQEGPYTTAVIEEKLATNQIGLLHELSRNGQWVTLRDFFAERDAAAQAERQRIELEKQHQREEAERQEKEREDRRQGDLLAEERKKNDLLQASLVQRQQNQSPSPILILKPHRAGTILALGIIGLFVCGPLCIAAWTMGDSDIREMDAGIMDKNGRPTTASGRNFGIIGTILWIIGIIVIIIH